MHLNALPPEVLNEITSYLLSDHLEALLLAGDKSLNFKLLEQSGVTTLNFFESPLPARGLPHLIDLVLNLHHLCVKHPRQKPWWRMTVADVLRLPRTLQSLFLYFNNDFEVVLSALSNGGLEHFTQLSTLSFKGICTQIPPASTWQFPASLTSLHVSALPVISLSHLPTSLISLTLNCRAISTDGAVFPALLNRLVLTTSQYCDYMKLLPGGLTSLAVYCSHAPPETPAEHWKLFPPQLTSLIFTMEPITEAALDNLPKSLTYLFLETRNQCEYNNNWLDHLPPNLTFLAGTLIPPRLDAELAKKLPRTLVSNLKFVCIEALPNLPRKSYFARMNLADVLPPSDEVDGETQHLNAVDAAISRVIGESDKEAFVKSIPEIGTLCVYSSKQTDFPESLAEILPRALNVLELCEACLSESAVKALPRGLQELRATKNEEGSMFESDECLKALPKVNRLVGAWRAYSLSPISASWLPRTLTRLHLTELQADLQNEWIYALPQTLQIVHLASPTWPSMSVWCSPLPPLLEAFTLTLTINKGVDFSVRNVLDYLPRKLLQLSIQFAETEKEDFEKDQAMRDLPEQKRQRTEKKAQEVILLTPELVKKLIPPRITEITLPNNVHIPEDCQEMMPASLAILRCANTPRHGSFRRQNIILERDGSFP